MGSARLEVSFAEEAQGCEGRLNRGEGGVRPFDADDPQRGADVSTPGIEADDDGGGGVGTGLDACLADEVGVLIGLAACRGFEGVERVGGADEGGFDQVGLEAGTHDAQAYPGAFIATLGVAQVDQEAVAGGFAIGVEADRLAHQLEGQWGLIGDMKCQAIHIGDVGMDWDDGFAADRIDDEPDGFDAIGQLEDAM